MISRLFRFVILLLVMVVLWGCWVVFYPVTMTEKPAYRLTVPEQTSFHQLTQKLEDDGVIRSKTIMLLLGRLQGIDRQIKTGVYRLGDSVSMWSLLRQLREGRREEMALTFIEGWKIKQVRNMLNKNPDIQHLTRHDTDEQLLQRLGIHYSNPEGLFFPDTYFIMPGASDVDILKMAHERLLQQLNEAWEQRRAALPYRRPYDLLIMASLVEKETGHAADRPYVAAALVNRLTMGMRLQTDPSVIYGMGGRYQGKITKADLLRDTPYNTYTRAGLPPTPIALPGRAALDAAANPALSKALYFVAKGDGRSHFSETLEEHNWAVRRYILKEKR